ncbi:MAG TPA: pilus assembly protein TadG-related protein [Caulobacteraceae bacterium]|jgi:Flp pilus assembly protein TadG
MTQQPSNRRRPHTVRRPFARDEKGGVAMTAALLLLPLTVLGFGAYDFGRASLVRANLQDALDASALAVARSSETKPEALNAFGVAVLTNTLKQHGLDKSLTQVSFKVANGAVKADAQLALKPVILKLFTQRDMAVGAHSEVLVTKHPIEIALVLDNTWSMTEPASSGGDKITALEKAAVGFVTRMQGLAAKAGGGDAVKMGVVPFSATVNVSSGSAGSSWIDSQGLSPVNEGLFWDGGKGSPHSWKEVETPKRLALFQQLGIAWKGCVESRPYPHDVRDTAASSSDPATLFAPYFAPDEPDEEAEDGKDWNDYLDDGIHPSWDNSGNLFDKYWRHIQGNAPKYVAAGLKPARGAKGPNNGCDTEPVTRLTTDLAKVKAAVTDMPVGGATNIPMGMVWGWHVLSPNAPFADGSPYSKKEVKRVAILITDGENALEVLNNKNQSKYTGVGYVWQNRLGTTAADFNARKQAMDGRLAELCTNMKAKGITVFTVNVQVKGNSTALMRNCASRPTYFQDVTDAGKLEKALDKIAEEITRLRISK